MISTHKSKCLITIVFKKVRNKCPPLHQVQHKIPSLYTQLSPPKLVVLLFVFIFEMFISFENLALCLLVVVVLLDTIKGCNYSKDEHFSIQNVKFTTEPRCDFQSGDVKKTKIVFCMISILIFFSQMTMSSRVVQIRSLNIVKLFNYQVEITTMK